MSNVIKLNDNAEIHLPSIRGSDLFRIFINNYQTSMSSSQPRVDATPSGCFYMASVTSTLSGNDYTTWNIDISREAAAALQVEGISFTEEAKEALSHE